MSRPYSVYQHPTKGVWGFSGRTSEGVVQTVCIDKRDGSVTRKSVDPVRVASLLTKLLRSGYTKQPHMQYLHESQRDGVVTGEFGSAHPDLVLDTAGDYIVFACVPSGADVGAVVSAWTERTGELLSGSGREAWLAHCRKATAYLAAFSNEPHAALLVAEWASEHNQVLASTKGTPPAAGPAQARYEWREFLAHWFPQGRVDQALAELGWPLAGALTPALEPTFNNLPAGDGDWVSDAKQAAF